MEQPQYNLLKRERFEHEYAPLFRDYRYGATTWSPLASGLLTGKYDKGIPSDSRAALKGYNWLHKRMTDPESLAKVRQLEPIARDLGCTLAQLSIAWILKNPNVSTVLTGASRIDQVIENMKAAEIPPKLTPEIMTKIDQATGFKPYDEED
jgi:aryl-alcohol dehydrogenase-like predicted oxidoreductase